MLLIIASALNVSNLIGLAAADLNTGANLPALPKPNAGFALSAGISIAPLSFFSVRIFRADGAAYIFAEHK